MIINFEGIKQAVANQQAYDEICKDFDDAIAEIRKIDSELADFVEEHLVRIPETHSFMWKSK